MLNYGGVGTTNKRFVMCFEEKHQSVDNKLNPITKFDLENKQHV